MSSAKSKPPDPPGASSPGTVRSRLPAWLTAALLALVTVAVYWPATGHDFVNYDDPGYVAENAHVTGGLTLENLKGAFVNIVCSNWHPLTMVSHMLDCQLFGLRPWGHHLTSVLLHAANTGLVFLLLRALTGAFWRSALVAALFGWHPLHVESVAWVAERKDVLSTCFGLLSLLFYTRYAQQKILNPQPSTLNYGLALFFFALGLMSKAMLVTWPFVLLLLDYWPLGRVRNAECGVQSQKSVPHLTGATKPSDERSTLDPDPARAGSLLLTVCRLVLEKIPFFALAAVASVVTYVVQLHGGAVKTVAILPPGARAGNALVSYCRYLGKLFWPVDLAVFYPHPGYWPLTEVLMAGGLLLGITVFVFVKRGRYPYLLMGWLWYCGTVVPVLGLVQMGRQAMADRYTYIPSLGILIVAIWGAYELARSRRHQVIALSVAACAASVICLALTRQQLGYWRDSVTLFRHAIKVTENNYLAHNNLGNALDSKGQSDEAISQFKEAIRLRPNDASAHYNLGLVLVKKGQTDEAIGQFQEAIRLRPDDAQARNNLGNALLIKGQTNEAAVQYQEAIRLQPDAAKAHYNLGTMLADKGQFAEAIRQYQEAIRLRPDDAGFRNHLGLALAEKGQIDEAISEFRAAVRLKPDDAMAHYNLGAALEKKGQTAEAVGQYQETIRLGPDFAAAYNNLGYLWARRGENLDQARALIEKAVGLEPKNAAFLDSLGWVLFKLNHPREALKYQLQAIDNCDRPDASLYDHLGDIYAALNQRAEAAEAWRRSVATEPNRQVQEKLDALSAH
jgi:tetratricopeptide (TPR) repeat protein